MAISWGVSPIAWANDDLPALGGAITADRIMAEANAIGFEGIELGNRFPRDPALLSSQLSAHDLRLIGGWYGSSLLTRSAEAEIATLQTHLALLQELGSDVFILAETSNAIHGQQGTPLTLRPRLQSADWAVFGARLDRVAAYLADRGFRLAYHHHLGTIVETGEDLHSLIEATGDQVRLTLDTGHATLAGIDPVAIVRQYSSRIAHVHCKDVRAARFAALKRAKGSFLDGVVEGMFTVPGDGDMDFAPLLRALADIGYDGWVVIEAEQDPAKADPATYQRLGLDTLRRIAAETGLVA